MAQLYNKQQLREIFQSPFNQEAWKAILHNLFRAEMIRKKSEKFTADDDNEDGFFLGALNTSDSFRIGLFYFVIKTGSVAHKKVGLRNLVKQFVNPTWGEFDAAIVVFDDKREWRLSFVCDIKDVKTTPKRYTFVFGEHDNFYRTAIERFLTIQNSEPSFENIRKAFSVDALSDDFFDTYREYYADFVQYITGKRYVKEGNKWVERELGKPNFQYTTTFDCDDKLVRDYVKKMFGRIVFLYFLQRKGWLNGDRQYMHNLFYNSTAKDNFLDGVLEPLFFEVLNTDKQYRTADANALPGSENIPYLNGGLFARDEIDELDCVFPEEYFKKLFDFLDSYNFTIDENDVDDAEIGIDPEMLGRIFENLLEDNKDKGAFYTPKEIVNYMCRESLIAYLQNGAPERSHELIRNFVENYDASQLNADQSKYLRKKLQDVKICDPAIGSGAFPMGLVNILSRLYIAMKADTDTSKMKRHIIENNIYGVDIEKGAVDIARLRFWLAMIVEEKEPMPLHNLHFKIMQGNSLLESINGIDLSDLTKTKATRNLFDSTDTERENLKTALSHYYNTSNHTERDRLFNEIINNVRRQIYAKDPNIDQTGLDPSATDKFFLWHTWFADVFDNGGFDIVIGNPPYGYLFKDSKYRNQIISNYSVAEYKVEAYSVFTQLAHKLLRNNGVLSFITPYTFVSGIYFSKFRKFLANTGVRTFVLLGKKVFEDAEVDTAIFLLQKEKNIENIQFADLRPFESARDLDSIQLSQIRSSDFFAKCDEVLLTATKEEIDIYLKLYNNTPDRLENAVEFYHGVQTRGNGKALTKQRINNDSLPIIKGADFNRYKYPVHSNYITFTKDNIKSGGDISYYNVPKKLVVRTTADRIIASIDYNRYIALNSVNVAIPRDNSIDLEFVLAVLNSKLMEFWYRMTVQETAKTFAEVKIVYLNRLHLLSSSKDTLRISKMSKTIYDTEDGSNVIDLLDTAIYKMYNLTYSEVLIVDPSTKISPEEYENFTL